MGEILGLGVTHGPYVLYPEDSMANILKRRIQARDLTEDYKDPANWPEAMRKEWGDDEGLAAAHTHRMQLVEGFRKARAALDAFKPDVVVIWGDDQYENFHEDVVPAFCVYIEEEFHCQPWSGGSGLGVTNNVWGEAADWTLSVPGHWRAAKDLTHHLLGNKFDVAWAYKQLHHDFGHAFWRTVAHLDYDRTGFNYPVIPFHVNCYGSRFTRNLRTLGEDREFDPPGPTPERCFELGGEIARFFKDSPYRVALIGSSSWSHAFLTPKNRMVWPDVDSDKARYAELAEGNYKAWRDISVAQLEDAGQYEMLNWVCLAGAMDELGQKPTYTEFVESYVFNSSKVIAIMEPNGVAAKA
jgi:hypothetical protein